MPNPTTDIFSEMVSMLTGGIIPDLKTAIMAFLTIYLIYVGLDLLVTKTYGLSISERLEYNEYSYKRRKSEDFDRMYQNESNKHLPVGPAPDPKRKSSDSYLGI